MEHFYARKYICILIFTMLFDDVILEYLCHMRMYVCSEIGNYLYHQLTILNDDIERSGDAVLVCGGC